MERNEFQSSARLSRAAVAQWRKEIATNRNCFSQVPSSAAAFEEKSARLSFLTIPDPRKGDRQREREREREGGGEGEDETWRTEKCKVSRRGEAPEVRYLQN